ncbi:GAF domain-containing sensor histidine kinase [Nocardioides dongkuii]|uniref:GAF domain-containing sensor histidine kinase n=1 Tax=Nocardioides dongkuii TaxID=2760089 RepID=UPI0018775EF1|nr:GAF domain-containing sensor histidine kinase [Nocardioides dongkuii]
MRYSSGNFDKGPRPSVDEAPTFDDLMIMATKASPAAPLEGSQRLLDAVASLSSGLSLDDTLARILQAGVDLTGARYGGLTLVDWDEEPPLRLSFTVRGATANAGPPLCDWPPAPGVRAGAVDLPAAPEPDEVLAGQEPRRPGDRHVPMEAGIRVGDRVLGALRLTEKVKGAAFTEEDERMVSALAGAAGVVIENARLRKEAALREGWLASTADVPRFEPDDTALQLVADWARELAGADVAWVVANSDQGSLRLRVVSGFDADPDAMSVLDFRRSLARCAAASGRTLKVKNISKHRRAVDVSAALGFGPMGPGLVVPICNPLGLQAVITLAWRASADPASRPEDDASLPTTLAEQAPLVLRVARTGQDEQRQAVMQDRDRIARDLHDLVIQQLFALGLELQGISWLRDPDEIARRLDRTTDEIDATIRDIRRTIFSLGSMDDDPDPQDAVVELVERAARTMKVHPTLEFRGPIGSVIDSSLLPDVLAVLSEGLSNVVRHAHAASCSVEVSVVDEVVVRVTDDGTGMPDAVHESGLANVRRRAQRRGGHLGVTSSPAHGTSLVWSVPII